MTLDEVMALADDYANASEPTPATFITSDDLRRIKAATAEAYAALRAAIEQYARGDAAPVAWIQPDHLQKARVYPFLCRVEPTQRMADFVPVFTRPSRPLTDEQIESIRRQCVGVCSGEVYSSMFARAIERAHGITAQVK